MVVLFFNKDFNSIYSGGVDRITYNLSSQFVESGIKVIFLSLFGDYIGFERVSPLCLHLPDIELESENNIRFFRSIIADYKVDIIINQAAMNPQLFCFLKTCVSNYSHVKIISCVHNLVITPGVNWGYQQEYNFQKRHLGFVAKLFQSRLSKRILKWLYIRKYRNHYRNLEENSSSIVALCDGHRNEIEEMIGYESSKVVVIPNCLSPDEVYKPVEKEPIALWVGRLDFTVKRLDIMLRVWQRFSQKKPDWHLYVLGTSREFEQVENLARRMNLLNIHFEGMVEPSSYYDKASLTFVTSSHESFSMVILESMFHRVVPIVFNTFPAASYLVKDGHNGVLVEPYDIDTCLNRVYNLLDENGQADLMSENASVSARRFYPSEIFRLWKDLFEDIKN